MDFLIGVLLSILSTEIEYTNPTPLEIIEVTDQVFPEVIEEEKPIIEEVVVIPVEPVVCETIYEYGCSCMIGLVDRGYPVGKINAEDLQSNTVKDYIPVRDDIILFKYDDVYHAASVRWRFPSGNIQVYECNYRAGTCGKRIVYEDDPFVRGYIHNPEFSKLNI